MLLLGILLGNVALANGPDCEAIHSIEQNGREFVSESTGYQELKQKLIDALLKQSVEQVLGKQITANERTELKVHNNELEESLRALNVERAKGFITSYRILPPGEKIIQMGGMAVMELALSADVCIPKYRGADYVVAIGEVLDERGNPVPARIVEKIVSEITKNPRYSAIRLPAPPDSYFDYQLSGRVTGTTVREVENLGGKLGASIIRKLTNKKQDVADRVLMVEVRLALQFEDVVDQTASSYIGKGLHSIPRRSSRTEQASAALIAMEEAAQDALKKLTRAF